MIFMTFIFMHSVIICVVLLWRTYEIYPALSLKSGCDKEAVSCIGNRAGTRMHDPRLPSQANQHG
jgi:hypothetical protein